MILALDPGETTGYAWFDGPSMIEAGEIPGGIDGFLEWWSVRLYTIDRAREVVVEDFIVQPSFVGRPVPSEIIGAVKALWPGKLTIQPRSAKATLFRQTFTGDKGEIERRKWLEERGLYFLSDHAMDAATHALVAKKRDRAFWKRYWA